MKKSVAHNVPAADVMVLIVVAAQKTHVAVKLLTGENVAGEYVTFAARSVCSSVVYMWRGVAKEASLVIQMITMAD